MSSRRPRHAFDGPPRPRVLPDLDEPVPAGARFRVSLTFWAWLVVAISAFQVIAALIFATMR